METDPLLLPLPSSPDKQNFLGDISLSVNDELDGKLSTISIFVSCILAHAQVAVRNGEAFEDDVPHGKRQLGEISTVINALFGS
jgi:hypothetical protein